MEEPAGNEINTELHQAVFNNDLKTLLVLLRTANERNIDVGGKTTEFGVFFTKKYPQKMFASPLLLIEYYGPRSCMPTFVTGS